MAALASAVELPTHRDSYQPPEADDNIKNPRWIPVLRKTDSVKATSPKSEPSQEKELSPYTGASFSPIPKSTPTSPKVRPVASRTTSVHSYSKSSTAPEILPVSKADPIPDLPPLPPPPPIPPSAQAQYNVELPATRPTSRFFESYHIPTLSGNDTVASTDTEATADTSATDSTATTASTVEDGAAPPAAVTADKEDSSALLVPLSSRSSISSAKRLYTVSPPTSKYARKPVAGSGLSTHTTPAHSRTHTGLLLSSPKVPPEEPQPIVPQPSSPSATPKPAGSLHPTPSNVSLASQKSSDKAATATAPAPPSTQENLATPSHPHRASSLGHGIKQPSARKPETPSATPKPEHLQPGPKSPEKDNPKPNADLQRPEQARLKTPSAQTGKVGIASFMTANNTVIFRRFDEVHVQLLLTVQDEITQLERELMRLDSVKMTRGERDVERSRVLRELRKVVAEYGKLHRLRECPARV